MISFLMKYEFNFNLAAKDGCDDFPYTFGDTNQDSFAPSTEMIREGPGPVHGPSHSNHKRYEIRAFDCAKFNKYSITY